MQGGNATPIEKKASAAPAVAPTKPWAGSDPVQVIRHIKAKRQETWPQKILDIYPDVQLAVFKDGERTGLGVNGKVVQVRSPHA